MGLRQEILNRGHQHLVIRKSLSKAARLADLLNSSMLCRKHSGILGVYAGNGVHTSSNANSAPSCASERSSILQKCQQC